MAKISSGFREDCHRIIDHEERFLLIISTARAEGKDCFMVSLCGRLAIEQIAELPSVVMQATEEAMDREP